MKASYKGQQRILPQTIDSLQVTKTFTKCVTLVHNGSDTFLAGPTGYSTSPTTGERQQQINVNTSTNPQTEGSWAKPPGRVTLIHPQTEGSWAKPPGRVTTSTNTTNPRALANGTKLLARAKRDFKAKANDRKCQKPYQSSHDAFCHSLSPNTITKITNYDVQHRQNRRYETTIRRYKSQRRPITGTGQWWSSTHDHNVFATNNDEHHVDNYVGLVSAMKPTQGVRFVGYQPQNRTGESPAGRTTTRRRSTTLNSSPRASGLSVPSHKTEWVKVPPDQTHR